MSQCWSCSVGVSSDREFCAKCEKSLLAEREARRPLPVSTLLSARQETIHRDPGAARAARSVRMTEQQRLRIAREQLAAIVEHYPTFAGDTLSHEAAQDCERRGWIRRDLAGNWIPTASGLSANLENA